MFSSAVPLLTRPLSCRPPPSPAYSNSNGGARPPGLPSGGPPTNAPAGPAPGPVGGPSYGSYYQNDPAYAAVSPGPKPPNKKGPMHPGAKAHFPGTLSGGGPPGVHPPGVPAGPGVYSQYSQGYGTGKKNFAQPQGGAGGYPYSTAYPSQVTGGGVAGNQDYGYEGEQVGGIASNVCLFLQQV